jgi:hypothetical protein
VLTILDADRLAARYRTRSLAGVGAVNYHPEDPANRFTANLDVENLEAVTGSDAPGRLSHALTDVVSARSHRGHWGVGPWDEAAPARRIVPLKNK